jgi:hypothetical protein
MEITVRIQAKPSLKTIKARKQVKQGKERALKAKLRGMVNQAKSQLKGLENAGLDTPAKQKLLAKTDLKTKGKSYNQLQSIYFAVDQFLKSQTASVRGATQNLNQIAKIIGMPNVPVSTLASYASQFFQIASYAKQTLQSYGQSIGSERLFQAIRKVSKQYKTNWDNATSALEKTEMVLREIQKQQELQAIDEFEMFTFEILGVKK